jgi:hypothetical protein
MIRERRRMAIEALDGGRVGDENKEGRMDGWGRRGERSDRWTEGVRGQALSPLSKE